MIRGTEFEISQETTNTLFKAINCLNIDLFHWHIVDSQEEVWDKGQKKFFDKEDYDGDAFAKKIKLKHHIVFLKIQAYFAGGVVSDIQTYDDFLQGDCQILILASDCEFMEIYCKDNYISKIIHNNAITQEFKNVKFITDENDQRTVMNVL